MRSDARPGREPSLDAEHWVAHARAGWSRQHLEQPADWVQRQMQAALQDRLGEPIQWQHAVVHRWRYAMPQTVAAASGPRCWWDGARGLGVCGDFLGDTGVEGAWQSAQALIEAMSRELSPGSTLPDASLTDHRIQRAAA
jgi:predicted NAD/FAD-dependent oxidoreductase